MAPKWTDEQKKVIELHERNILVSAAAGSGKTAVLVQRIIEMISNEAKPVDIDKLVIVTFTNAAAYEMRQRITDAIENLMILSPDNVHLRRQQTLINNAQITTIDSFCLNIIRNYFSEIDLDPGFKVADEGELKLIMSDMADQVIEDYYNEGSAEFIDFVECFTPEKTDDNLSDYILNLYRAAQSHPWPEEWLQKCRDLYTVETDEELLGLEAVKYLNGELIKHIVSAQGNLKEIIKKASVAGGPYMYLEMLNDDLMFLESVINGTNPFEIAAGIKEHSWMRLSAKKDESVDEELRDRIKDMRNAVKKDLNGAITELLKEDLNGHKELILGCSRHINVYIDMVLEFSKRFADEKRRKNIINFNDMEHLVLDILVRRQGNEIVYTDVANELSSIYEEILIDEYQDSNLLQELILNSISRERFGNPNVFMVGDVKQSIYRFRLARPELFVEKYDSYSFEDSRYQKIELHNNFRSRKEVLDSVNEVFEKIMKKMFGDIEYDDNAKLYAGADYPHNPGELGKTEVLILDKVENSEYSELEAEAIVCANEINKIVNNEQYLCFDKEKEQYRKIEYRDITILMRSAKKDAGSFIEILERAGIPAVSEIDTGYFSSYEVVILLNLLNVIDNPRQDIPLVAVLKSYFGGFNNNELALIRSNNKDKTFYDAFMATEGDKKDGFIEFLDELRQEAKYRKIHELIWNIVYDTGYYDYVGTMPFGAERQANIDMLMERAKAYEKTSLHGLFNFVRYIERLKNYDVDYGGASLSSEQDNVVKIMTIHKSKGLEFPVVFLANANKQFNSGDSKEKIVIDSDLGIGIDYMDHKTRVRKVTIMKRAAVTKVKLAGFSEEQRVLYVAMTRAREKLYIIGTTKNTEKVMAEWDEEAHVKQLEYSDLISKQTYLDMIMPAALAPNSSFVVSVIENEAFERIKKAYENVEISVSSDNKVSDAETEVSEEEFVYPYNIVDMPVKMSVSEIKHMGQSWDDEYSYKLVEDEIPNTIPQFLSEKEPIHGAVRGSAYHKFMELIDYEKCHDYNSIEKYLKECVDAGKISKEWADAVAIKDILTLLDTDFGKGLKKAFLEGKLYRERQFVMGIPANTVKEHYDSEELILVQGIIDVFYENEQGIVLADYKTDNVPMGEEGRRQLIQNYAAQIDYYAKAIENLTGKKIVKKIIYSFKLGQEIYLQ